MDPEHRLQRWTVGGRANPAHASEIPAQNLPHQTYRWEVSPARRGKPAKPGIRDEGANSGQAEVKRWADASAQLVKSLRIVASREVPGPRTAQPPTQDQVRHRTEKEPLQWLDRRTRPAVSNSEAGDF